jgi:alpha-ketoglutarate-dependent taurine dioxygenase
MKVTKMPGFGSYGAIVDNFDWNNPNDYAELGELNLQTLATVVRGDGTDRFNSVYEHLPWAVESRPFGLRWVLKYGSNWRNCLTAEDLASLDVVKHWAIPDVNNGWIRVSGKRNEQGKYTGLTPASELLWHTDEASMASFSPVLVMYGMEHMTTSATGFLQTADWYNQQSSSFKSELDELVSIYHWDNDKVSPGADIDNELVAKGSLVPVDGETMPMVIESPGGIKGINFSTLITGFVGMSDKDSARILDKISKELFVPENIFDYWWERDCGDMILFDQSITMHRRIVKPGYDYKTELSKRMAYRIVGDYVKNSSYNPFKQNSEAHAKRQQALDYIAQAKTRKN